MGYLESLWRFFIWFAHSIVWYHLKPVSTQLCGIIWFAQTLCGIIWGPMKAFLWFAQLFTKRINSPWDRGRNLSSEKVIIWFAQTLCVIIENLWVLNCVLSFDLHKHCVLSFDLHKTLCVIIWFAQNTVCYHLRAYEGFFMICTIIH